ncbi:dephospho-CoA kinase [Vibrio sonorensis]|uniref:dephospho-CoA kinase n=1 Tax=Vibrio sonorensis TaxID=1004316 RepID=UPI0008DAF769|nr:dephospho-CoA kinase [Vibrio sonorensis]
MPYVVGLTGGIASGKTTVANMFSKEFSIDIVDADVIARQVVEVGSEGLSQIVHRYGEKIVLEDGSLNRSQLREIIFSDPSEKKWIDSLLHPLIRQEMKKQLQDVSSDYALLVIPLMVENGLQNLADRVLVVDVDEKTQIERTQNRDGVDENQAKSILAAQATRQQRLEIADDVVKNSTKNQKLLPQITELHKKYLALSRANR